MSGACLVCGGRLGPARIPGLLACRGCGFITADVRMSEAELAALYGPDYFHGEEYHDYLAEEDSLRANFRRRIATLQRLVQGFRRSRLFEIGCAYGFFLDEVKPHVAAAAGMDISAEVVARGVARLGVDATYGDYLAAPLPETPDIIAMWDTIEHLPRPDLFLEKAAADLVPGGHIAITTGNIGSAFARLRGKGWRMIHPPTHLHYFSAATLTRLLEAKGFEVVHLSHPGVTRNVQSALYIILALKLRQPSLFSLVRAMRAFNFRLTVNLFDIMFVVARKRR